MRHLWSIAAERIITSQETKSISLINVLDTVTLTSQPGQKRPKGTLGVPIVFTLVTMWARDDLERPEQGHSRVLVRDPQGKALRGAKSTEYAIDLTKTAQFRTTLVFQGFPFTVSGWYQIVVQSKIGSKWTDAAAVLLRVIEQPPKEKDQ